jgi:hypothetical protein
MKRNAALVATLVLAVAAVAYSGPATNKISSSDKRAARILAVEELATLHSFAGDLPDRSPKEVLDFQGTMVKQFSELLDEESWTTKFFNARQKLTLEEKEELAAIEGGENEIWKLANGWVVYVRGIRATKANCVQCHRLTTGPKDLEVGDLIGAVRVELKAEPQ